MLRRSLWTFAVLVGATLLFAQGAAAATISATCSTLQTALDSANSGDVVALTGTCSNESFTVTNTNQFTLEGVGDSGGAPTSGFDGNNSSNGGEPVISSSDNVNLTIQNLLFENATLTNTSAALGGSAIDISGTDAGVSIKDDAFHGNSGGESSLGGAVNVTAQGTTEPIVVQDSTFSDNQSADGGAVYLFTMGPVHVTGNTFTGNAESQVDAEGQLGGALDVEVYGAPQDDPITISSNTFGGTGSGQGNSAEGWGGAAFISAGGSTASNGQTVTMDSNRFIDNQIVGNTPIEHLGGAVAFGPGDDEYGFKVSQSGNLFQGNRVGGTIPSGDTDDFAGGGAEWGLAVTVNSTRDTFTGNQLTTTGTPSPYAPVGGAVGVIGYVGSFTGIFANPISSYFTGQDDVFLNNSLPADGGLGGAIYTGGGVEPDCLDDGNTSNSVPACPPSHLVLYDSTVTGNSVNTSTGEGGAIWGGSKDTAKLDNSIVYGNDGVPGSPEIWGYSNPTYSYDDACTMEGGGGPLTGTGNICANPKLSASGVETASSPTIDRGSNKLVPAGLTTDAAGHPRITDGLGKTCQATVDMGAFESPAVPCLAVPSTTKPPAISGKPQRGQTLTCSTGSWSPAATGYAYQWERNGKAISGADKRTYVVAILDSATTLTCRVTARDASGAGAPATSAGLLVVNPGTLGCPKPTGGVSGIKVGPLALGMTPTQAKGQLHTVTVSGSSRLYCLYGGFDIRAAFSTSKKSKRRLTIAVTSNPFYKLDGIQPGTNSSAHSSTLKGARHYQLNGATWYVLPGSKANGVVKVIGGVIQIVGLAQKALTTGRAGTLRLLGEVSG
jgi:hypothetical protein